MSLDADLMQARAISSGQGDHFNPSCVPLELKAVCFALPLLQVGNTASNSKGHGNLRSYCCLQLEWDNIHNTTILS